VVPLTSTDAVRRAAPTAQAMAKIVSEDGQSMAYVFCLSGTAAGGRDQALARFFFPAGGAILEDPATGSATANFGAWCLMMKRALPVQLQISQGEFVARPSTLFLDVNREAQVFVGGDVLEIGRGCITL
jgi:trans-2,3-dihydro-3-hydroxyanthranilate isomerase